MVHLRDDAYETSAIFMWCTGVKKVQKCSHSHTLVGIYSDGYRAGCILPWVNGVIPHLLPDDWTLEQNKRGKAPEEEC